MSLEYRCLHRIRVCRFDVKFHRSITHPFYHRAAKSKASGPPTQLFHQLAHVTKVSNPPRRTNNLQRQQEELSTFGKPNNNPPTCCLLPARRSSAFADLSQGRRFRFGLTAVTRDWCSECALCPRLGRSPSAQRTTAVLREPLFPWSSIRHRIRHLHLPQHATSRQSIPDPVQRPPPILISPASPGNLFRMRPPGDWASQHVDRAPFAA